MKTFVSIYRDKDGSTFVGEPTQVETIDDLIAPERLVLKEIPSLSSVEICECHAILSKGDTED